MAGAAGVDRRTFLLGVTPATVGWVGVFVVLGAAVGLPVEHFLGEVQKLALQGGILIAMGAGAFVAIRRVPPGDRGTLVRVPDQVRVLLALGVDLGLVASMLSGVVAVVRRLVGAGVIAGWADALVVASGIGIFYLIITRRSTGEILPSITVSIGVGQFQPGESMADWSGEGTCEVFHGASAGHPSGFVALSVLARSHICTCPPMATSTRSGRSDVVRPT